ncbi:MAG TPA: hypothetical protein VN611_11925 [Patescibacteria group bacterium]|nr:hypothetical protein [Patescibacteria group bacterium]
MNNLLSWKAVGYLLLAACFLVSGLSLAAVSAAPTPGANPGECREGTPPPPEKQDRKAQLSKVLATLTKEGRITPDQANQLQVFFREKEAQHKAEFEKIRSLTPEERQAYFQQNPPPRHDIIGDLKAAANLTGEQAKLVAEALRPQMPPPPPFNEQKTNDILARLVGDNTITADQSDKLVRFLKEKSAQHQAMFEKIGKMTPEERQTFFQQNPPPRHDMVADLQAAAGLTPEQAKAVAEAFRPPHHQHPPLAQPGFNPPPQELLN